jgi:hypothetical protein
MITRQVTCIKQSKEKGVITHICGNWELPNRLTVLSEDVVIKQFKAMTHAYWVVKGKEESKVIIVTINNKEYLKTTPDNTKVDNLLTLPECGL